MNKGKINKIPISYWQRYLSFYKYASFKKVVNFLKALYLWKTGVVQISTKPSFLKVEISRKCALNCLYCSSPKEEAFYPLDLFKNIIDQLKEFIFLTSLYDIGEPLENPEILEYIKYARQNKIGTIISTSLSIEKEDGFWSSLVTSGIDKIIVAIDGISENVYRTYRKNGNLDLVLYNLSRLLAYSKVYKSNVIIEWQMLDLPWNKHEQSAAKKIALQMGCNNFRLIKEASALRKFQRSLNHLRNTNCIFPYLIFIVTAKNMVRSCYKNYHDNMIVGDFNRSNFDDIWNGQQIQKLRSKIQIQKRDGCKICME